MELEIMNLLDYSINNYGYDTALGFANKLNYTDDRIYLNDFYNDKNIEKLFNLLNISPEDKFLKLTKNKVIYCMEENNGYPSYFSTGCNKYRLEHIEENYDIFNKLSRKKLKNTLRQIIVPPNYGRIIKNKYFMFSTHSSVLISLFHESVPKDFIEKIKLMLTL